MAKHRRRSSKKKVAPSLVLGASVLSVASPLAFIFSFTPKVEAEPTQTLTLPKIDPAGVVAEGRERATPPPTHLPTSKSRPQIRTHTTTTPPVSRPILAVSTKPHPTIVERQTQRATRSHTLTSHPLLRTTSTPKPRVRKQTTTTTPPPPPPPLKSNPTIVTTPPVSALVTIAKKYVGTEIPYLMGGNSLTKGMDCSHFVWMVLKEAGYNVSYRDSGSLASWSARTTSPKLGDLVLFTKHVGIYAGNGMMIDQGSSGGAHLQKVYTQGFIGYGRLPL